MVNDLLLEKLGSRIKELRIDKAMTQDKLSIESDIEKSMLSRIESGRVNFTIRTLYKISKALNAPITDFFREWSKFVNDYIVVG